jgi:hypothetical protein
MTQYKYSVFYDTDMGYSTKRDFYIKDEALDFFLTVKNPWILTSEIVKYGIDSEYLYEGDRNYFTSYELTAYGNSLEELIKDASVSEIDQDGGEINTTSIEDCSSKIRDQVLQMLTKLVEEK